jgi:hypothetical protein
MENLRHLLFRAKIHPHLDQKILHNIFNFQIPWVQNLWLNYKYSFFLTLFITFCRRNRDKMGLMHLNEDLLLHLISSFYHPSLLTTIVIVVAFSFTFHPVMALAFLIPIHELPLFWNLHILNFKMYFKFKMWILDFNINCFSLPKI